MGRGRKHKRSRAAATSEAAAVDVAGLPDTPHKKAVEIIVMDDPTPPPTPHDRESVSQLTISAVDISTTLEDTHSATQQQRHAPPSPASVLCAPGQTRVSLVHSPAWEASGHSGDPSQRQHTAIPDRPSTAPAATSTSASGCAIAATSHSAPPKQASMAPLSAAGSGIVTPVAHSPSSEWFLSRPPLPLSAPPTSVWEGEQDPQRPERRVQRRAFFPASVESPTAPTPTVPAGAPEQSWDLHAVARGAGVVEEPPSARSVGSGIFQLEIASPDVVVTARGTEERDTPHTMKVFAESGSGAVVGRREWMARHESAAEPSVARGSSSALQGPWGRLQEVIDEIKVFSPQPKDVEKAATSSPVPTSTIEPKELLIAAGAFPPTPFAEERKGHAPATTSGGFDSATRADETFLSRMQSEQSPSPASPVPIVTSQPTPGGGMRDAESPICSLRQRDSGVMALETVEQTLDTSQVTTGAGLAHPSLGVGAVSTPSTKSLDRVQGLPGEHANTEVQVAVEGEAPRAQASPELTEGAALGAPVAQELTPARKAQTASEQRSRTAVGGSIPGRVAAAGLEDHGDGDGDGDGNGDTVQSSSSFPVGALLAPETREATRAWAAAVAPDRDVDSGKDTSSSESRSGFDTGWGRGWGLRGDPMEGENTEELLGTSWDSRRGFVGQQFIRAAEAIGSSPQLRRAAGAAAAAVTIAAGTARVLVASVQSFEDFVEEQLREDGLGYVLRRDSATGLLVPRGKTLTQTFVVAAGCYLCWEFRVKDHDLGFALRLRTQGIGGSREEDIFEMKRYPSGEIFQGRWTAEEGSTAVVVMVWDNSYSCLRPKTLAYKVQVLQPGMDPTAPPPPPPPTPVSSLLNPDRTFETSEQGMRRSRAVGEGPSGGSGPQVADTEAFAIDELEGEERHFAREGIMYGRATSGRGVGNMGFDDTTSWLIESAMGSGSTRQSRVPGAADVGTVEGGREESKGEEKRGMDARGRVEGTSQTIQIEDFLGKSADASGV